MAIRCKARLVEPPVAISPTTPLTIDFSSIIRPTGTYSLPLAVTAAARRAASLTRASRSGVFGCTKAEPGRWKPISSISIWLVLAVP